jgi:Protein of unknown function (DUF2971)
MDILSTSSARPVDGLLYHYTSPDGLLGIIQDRQIWATNLLFLNDSMELNYAIQMLQQAIEKMEANLPKEEFQFIKELGKQLGDINAPLSQNINSIYVCSFSKNEDQLSQWRGYCPDGSGFSIGFDINSSLGKLIEEQNFKLFKCIYDENEQLEIIRRFLEEVLNNFRKYGNDLANTKRWEDFFQLAPMLKHPKFQEEDEWRLISKPRGIDGVQFRSGKSMLIPYVKIKLDESKDKAGEDNKKEILRCIRKIYIGPSLHTNLSHISLENILRSEWVYGDVNADGMPIQKCEIIESDIPYRSRP